MRREYKLAADPIRWKGKPVREILQFADGRREVCVVVPEGWALDVRDALARAYRDGREDNAPHYHSATGTENTPCYCPSPLTYAPQGRTEYGSEEEL